MKRKALMAVLPGALAASTVEKYSRQANEQFFAATGDGFGGDVDEFMMATGAAASSQEPYVVVIENTHASATQTAILFGDNVYGSAENNGSGPNIVITMGVSTVPYSQLLRQSSTQPFDVVLTRIESSTVNQLARSLNRKFQDASGATQGQPITVSSYFSPEQYQSGIRDVKTTYTIDGNNWLEYPVLPETTVQFSFFVASKVNIALPLNGQAPVKEFAHQRVRTFGS